MLYVVIDIINFLCEIGNLNSKKVTFFILFVFIYHHLVNHFLDKDIAYIEQ